MGTVIELDSHTARQNDALTVTSPSWVSSDEMMAMPDG